MTERLGRFELRERLGAGGYGEVFRAYDPRLQREVALKVLHASDDSARLLREGRAAASISHPNVVSVFDVGEVDGRAYLAMELLRGRTLRSYVGDDDVDLKTKLAWLVMVARALEAAHARGIVHRDVKPDNVFVTDDGIIKVVDFGIAKQAVAIDRDVATRTFDPMRKEEALLEALTAPGVVHGTPDYMAPEQLRGERVTPAADQFAWGVVAYELIEGRRPWAHEDPIRQIEAVLFEEPAAMRVGGRVAATVKRCLAKKAEQRFSGLGAVVRSLKQDEISFAPCFFMRFFALSALVILLASRFHACVGLESTHFTSRAPATSAPASVDITAHSTGALAAYRAGKRALFDGSRATALEQLKHAVELDPNFAEAHLWRMIARTFIGDETGRKMFSLVQRYRALLPEKEQQLFFAIEPWGALPPDKASVEERLSALAQRYPADAEILFVLARYRFKSLEYEKAIQAADLSIAVDPSFAYARFVKAVSLIPLGQADAGIAELQRCISVSPAATTCLEALHTAFANEGRCGDAEQLTRRLIAIDPQNSTWYIKLANDLYGEGAAPEAVKAALERAENLTPNGDLPIARLAHQFALEVLSGRHRNAKSAVRDWLRAVAESADEDDHMIPTLRAINLYSSIGEQSHAISIADQYLRKVDGWTHNGFDFEQSFFVVSEKYKAGGIVTGNFERLRDTWVRNEERRFDAERPIIWMEAFASACRTREQAERAIRLLGVYGEPDILLRTAGREFELGNMYEMAGLDNEALAHFVRSASSCSEIDSPFAATHSRFRAALLYEKKQDRARACGLYRRVESQWGGTGSGFIEGRAAARRRKEIACPE